MARGGFLSGAIAGHPGMMIDDLREISGTIRAREGNTGILDLLTPGEQERKFVPSYDLEPPRELLLEFQELCDLAGNRLKSNYQCEGRSWFPTVLNYVHGRIFVPYVKYRSLVDKIIRGKLDVRFDSAGEFFRLVSLIQERDSGNRFRAEALNQLVALNNRRVLCRYPATLLFFRFTPDDFRTEEARKALDGLGVHYVQALGVQKSLLLQNLRKPKPYYFYGLASAANRFGRQYCLDHLEPCKRRLFAVAVSKCERMMSAFIREYRRHRRILRGSSLETLYGIDDTQVIFPLLYACQDRGIQTVAHQHGAVYNRLHASYAMEGIDPREFGWFDTVITWGEYWKDRMLAVNATHPPGRPVVGSDLFGDRFRFRIPPNGSARRKARNVLIPYEFLTNTYQVGRYLQRLMDLGYVIWFKPRADEKLDDQIDAYCLSREHREKLRVVTTITSSLMEEIDIVAGTMSTLVYQLLPYRKPCWVFETDYRYMDDLVEAGYAHRIRYEDLGTLDGHFFRPSDVDPKYLFSAESLSETLARHVLPTSGGHMSSRRAMSGAS